MLINDNMGEWQYKQVDEIKTYLNYRYLSTNGPV